MMQQAESVHKRSLHGRKCVQCQYSVQDSCTCGVKSQRWCCQPPSCVTRIAGVCASHKSVGVCRVMCDPNGLFCCGDPCQTIARGIVFRFADICTLFHHESQRRKVVLNSHQHPAIPGVSVAKLFEEAAGMNH